jgi:putative ABC transport system permease protein
VSSPAHRLIAGWRALAGTGGAAAAALGVLVLACVFLAVSGPRQSLGLRTRALQQALATTGPQGRSVVASVDYTAFDAGLGRPASAPLLDAARRELTANLTREGLPLTRGAADWSGLTSGFMPVSAGLAPHLSGSGNPAQLEVLYRGPLGRYARLAAGRLPVSAQPAGHGAVFQIAVTSATAARLELRPGARIGTGAGITLVVTGIIQPLGVHSPFWSIDPVAAAPGFTQRNANGPPTLYGAGFISPAELPLLEGSIDPAAMSLSWDFPLALGSLTADQAPALQAGLAAADAVGGVLGGSSSAVYNQRSVTLVTGLRGLLARFVQQDGSVGQVLSLLSVSLAVIGAAVVLLGAAILAERRHAEFAVMQARGASRWQLALFALRPGAVVTVLAAAAGAALAVALSPGSAAPLGWWLAGLTVAAALAGLPLITIRAHRAARLPSGPARPAARRAARRLIAEAVLAAAAVGGLIALRQPGPPAAGGSGAYVSLAPVLVAIPAVILVMRCYPVALRGLVRLSRIRPGATALVGFARAAQGISGALLPVFALILALAVVGLGTMIHGAVLRGEVAASWQRTGADAVIDASASSRPLTPEVQRQLASVAGVQRTAAVIVTSGSVHGTAVTVAAVRPAQYRRLIAATPGGAFPAERLGGPAAGAGRPVPVLAAQGAAAVVRRGSTPLTIGTRRVIVKVAGTVARVPGVPAGPQVVLPLQALGASPPPPTLMLIVGPRLDEGQLKVLIRRALPGATVAFRSTVLAALTTAPLPRSAYLAIAAGSAAAALLSLLVVLMTSMLGARSREVTLARMRVMGLGPGQARGLAVAEALPPVLAAVAGGIAVSFGLAPLVGPSIGLSAFTGSTASVPIRPELPLLAAAAAGLVIVALASLAAETLIAGRGRALRARE